MKLIDEADMMERLRQSIAAAGSQKLFAASAGVSQQYLSDVLRGKRTVGDKLLRFIRLQRVVLYRAG